MWKYIKAAFDAKFGMPIAVSWFIIAFTGVLTYYDTAFGIIGVGLMFGYIYALINSKVFVASIKNAEAKAETDAALSKVHQQLDRLTVLSKKQYVDLVSRCGTIIKQQTHETPPEELKQQAVGLSRLAGFYLQLLISKGAIENTQDDSVALGRTVKSLQKRITDLNGTSSEVRKSLQSQLDIVQQRLQTMTDMNNRLEFIVAELQRIEQQVELLREQTVADTEPSIVSNRIDSVTATLTGTNDWMKQNKELLGSIDDVFVEPPPIVQVN